MTSPPPSAPGAPGGWGPPTGRICAYCGKGGPGMVAQTVPGEHPSRGRSAFYHKTTRRDCYRKARAKLTVEDFRPCRRCGARTHSLAGSPAPECTRCLRIAREGLDEPPIGTGRESIELDSEEYDDA